MLHDEKRRRARCRERTRELQRRGTLPKGTTCQRCGGPATQNHHPDYSKPELFERVCADCNRRISPQPWSVGRGYQ